MKTIFKFFIAAFFTLGIASSYAEPLSPEAVVIEINDGILKVNGHLIEMPTNVETWNQVIGINARIIDLGRTAYAWDDYGIRALTDANGSIHDFSLYFRELPDQTPMIEDDRLPNKCFVGNFILEGIKLGSSLSLNEYNKMVREKRHRFKEGYVPVLYSTPGTKLNNSDYVFSVSSRIDRDLRAYEFEINYNYVPPFKPDPNAKHDHNNTDKLVESLKKDGNDLVDRAMKLLDMECEEK